MSYYQRHVFFCTNQRDGDSCCNDFAAHNMRDYMKSKIKALKSHGKGQIRINSAGCLGRCDDGPTVVVYPEGTWYTYVDEQDLDEIIEQHLVQGKEVERLKI